MMRESGVIKGVALWRACSAISLQESKSRLQKSKLHMCDNIHDVGFGFLHLVKIV
jgi:hypothetical protein